MSKVHNVVSGDTLGNLSIQYLGSFSKWKKIVGVNPQLNNRRTAVDGSPLIYLGDTLIIPGEENDNLTSPQTVSLGDGEQDVSIVIDGKKFTGFTGYEINLSCDSFDTFSFSAPYDLVVQDIKSAIMPFAFKTCKVYYLDHLLFTGYLLTPDPELQADTSEITLQGYPKCGILNDCTPPSSVYPIDYYNVTLKEVAEAIASPYGIELEFRNGDGDPFAELTIEPTEKILSALLKLAQQRKFLFTNDENGKLVFYTPESESAFMQFKQGELPLTSITAHFNAQGFYSHITGQTKTDSLIDPLSYTYENKYLINQGIMRHETIMVDDAETQTDLESAVLAHAGRMFADCITYSLTCEGHLNHNQELFKKGMSVCVEAPGAMITRQTNFIARNIKLTRSENEKKTEMELVLPGSFSEEPPEVLPWE